MAGAGPLKTGPSYSDGVCQVVAKSPSALAGSIPSVGWRYSHDEPNGRMTSALQERQVIQMAVTALSRKARAPWDDLLDSDIVEGIVGKRIVGEGAGSGFGPRPFERSRVYSIQRILTSTI